MSPALRARTISILGSFWSCTIDRNESFIITHIAGDLLSSLLGVLCSLVRLAQGEAARLAPCRFPRGSVLLPRAAQDRAQVPLGAPVRRRGPGVDGLRHVGPRDLEVPAARVGDGVAFRPQPPHEARRGRHLSCCGISMKPNTSQTCRSVRPSGCAHSNTSPTIDDRRPYARPFSTTTVGSNGRRPIGGLRDHESLSTPFCVIVQTVSSP